MTGARCFAYVNLPKGYCALSSRGERVAEAVDRALQTTVREAFDKRQSLRRDYDFGQEGTLATIADYSRDRQDDAGRHGIVLVSAAFGGIDLAQMHGDVLRCRDQLVRGNIAADISRLAIVGKLASHEPEASFAASFARSSRLAESGTGTRRPGFLVWTVLGLELLLIAILIGAYLSLDGRYGALRHQYDTAEDCVASWLDRHADPTAKCFGESGHNRHKPRHRSGDD